MIKKYLKSYVAIAFVIIFLLLLPKNFTEKIREGSVAATSPIYRGLSVHNQDNLKEDLDHVKLENALLAGQIQEVREYLISEERLEEHFKKLEWIQSEKESKKFLKRREELLLDRLNQQMRNVTAKVVYREPAFWSSLFWIDVGHNDNQILGYEVVASNSPVIVGNVVVGIVDYVGARQSRVRLITDASVCVSVRVLRGSEQNHLLLDHLNVLLDQFKFREDLFFSHEEQQNTLNILCHLHDNLKTSVHDRYLAKGELHGSSAPLWRSRLQTLKGVGFNYDYADQEGGARDLRTGECLDKQAGVMQEALLQEGDLLVTTGMDGIFPEGFHVALVEKVAPLEEGAIAYHLEAKSLILNFDEIRKVTILAPLRSPPF